LPLGPIPKPHRYGNNRGLLRAKGLAPEMIGTTIAHVVEGNRLWNICQSSHGPLGALGIMGGSKCDFALNLGAIHRQQRSSVRN
jgi:hypothetical protein